MGKEGENGKPNELADALVAGLKAVQGIRRASRKRVVGLAREAVGTFDRVLGAVAEL
jgi:hypothetical protein